MGKYIKGYKLICNDVLFFNKLIRNTYILLSTVLFFSAFIAWISFVNNVKYVNFILFFIVSSVLLYLINYYKNNVYSIFFVFLFTGFLGYNLGPILNIFLHNYINGHEIVFFTFFLTACMFLFLSFYAIFTKKQFNYVLSYCFVGFCLIIVLFVLNLVFVISFFKLFISFIIVLLSCAYILYDTSNLMNGEEKNYVLATINLYLNFYNLFLNLLCIFGLSFGKKD